jgi:hypothetical protein
VRKKGRTRKENETMLVVQEKEKRPRKREHASHHATSKRKLQSTFERKT